MGGKNIFLPDLFLPFCLDKVAGVRFRLTVRLGAIAWVPSVFCGRVG